MLGITENIVTAATYIIAKMGPLGIAGLMALESMITPVPSEAVMPFAGFLWFTGELSFFTILIASTGGSILGSLLSYYMGLYGGIRVVRRFGRYLLLDEHHLEFTERFFLRHGEKTIFVSRFIPIVRHFISIFAGIGRMPLGKFIAYTAIGAALWNMFLAYMGYVLRSRWEIIRHYSEIVDVIALLGIGGCIIYGVMHYRKRHKHTPHID